MRAKRFWAGCALLFAGTFSVTLALNWPQAAADVDGGTSMPLIQVPAATTSLSPRVESRDMQGQEAETIAAAPTPAGTAAFAHELPPLYESMPAPTPAQYVFVPPPGSAPMPAAVIAAMNAHLPDGATPPQDPIQLPAAP